MEKFICKECNKVYETLKGLSSHRFQKHKIKPQDTYDEYVLNGVKPTCNCGCGIVPKFLTITNGYRDYVHGHSSRVNNNWGHNPDAISKSHETQKKMYESGELTIWNKGLTIEDPRVKDNIDKVMSNPNRGKNISKGLTGVPKNDEHKIKLSNASKLRWLNPVEREIQSHKRMLWMSKNNYTVKSKIEDIINVILMSFGLKEDIDYERQSYVRDIKSYYDFKIFKYNTFIEVDGDFWHCNPNTKHNKPIYESQFKNLEKDKIKTNWCKENNYNLIRFWEYDINNNLDNVINTLKLLL
jgi:very-short-patch-repair endonuclease